MIFPSSVTAFVLSSFSICFYFSSFSSFSNIKLFPKLVFFFPHSWLCWCHEWVIRTCPGQLSGLTSFFLVYLFILRETETAQVGEEQRERVTKNQMLNWLSHPGAPERLDSNAPHRPRQETRNTRQCWPPWSEQQTLLFPQDSLSLKLPCVTQGGQSE